MDDISPVPADKAHRLNFAADILQGMSDGIDGDRLTALIEWAVYGSISLASPDALESIFAAPWVASKDEGEFDGYPLNEARKDIERVSREADAILAAIPSDGWREIESAPKDGTRFLAWITELGGVDFIHWQDGPTNVGWRDSFIRVYREGDFGGPTHWMPLPAPPAPTGGRNAC